MWGITYVYVDCCLVQCYTKILQINRAIVIVNSIGTF